MPFPSLDAWLPAPTGLLPKQRLIIMTGAFIGIGVAALICGVIKTQFALSWWLMAPLGATAAQIFSVPASPMSQPWPVVAGHVLSAMAGLIAFHLFGYSTLSAALAVGLAVGLMLQARALHPSGGGTALLVVMSQTQAWDFVLFPVLINACLLVLVALAWHRLTGHAYPHSQRLTKRGKSPVLHRFDPADLEEALQAQGEILDVSREDIQRVLAATEMNAYRRLAKDLTCEQIMTKPVKHVGISARVSVARHILMRNRFKLLPVTADQQRLAGAVSDLPPEAEGTVSAYLHQSFVTAMGHDSVADVLPLLSEERGHILVIDEQRRLKGIISKSDIMRALIA